MACELGDVYESVHGDAESKNLGGSMVSEEEGATKEGDESEAQESRGWAAFAVARPFAIHNPTREPTTSWTDTVILQVMNRRYVSSRRETQCARGSRARALFWS